MPLQRFLEKNILKSKVNNWALEIKQFQIKFENLKHTKYTLENTRSILVELDPGIYQDPKPEGHKYGFCVLQLPNVSEVQNVSHKANPEINKINSSNANSAVDIELNISEEKLHQLQQKDNFCKRKWKQL